MKKFYSIIYIGILMLLLAGCQDEGMFTPETDGDELVYVTYRVNMGDVTLSRVIGDAQKVNELKVGVFQNNQLLKVFTIDKEENAEAFTNVKLPLLKQETYDLVFWAQKKDNGIYSIDENFNISIDYTKYQDISLAGTEDFEAFTTVKTGVSVANPGETSITLIRPFAQLNIAASEEDIFNKVNKVSFTIDKVYKKFNPLAGVSSEEETGRVFTYSFSEQDIDAKQTITIGGTYYYYLASAYLLAPENVKLIGGLYKDSDLVKELNVNELPLSANSRTNIYGEMIQQEELQGWDGVTFTQPELIENQYVIDAESDLAWLGENGSTLEANKTFIVTKKIDMAGKDGLSSINLPAGSTFDGKAHIIKGIRLNGAFFGDATNLKVQNLIIEDAIINSTSSHAGVLVNTLKGSSTFSNVTISNSSVTTTNGAAGGMVGYVVRTTEKDRNEILNVLFNSCKLNGVKVAGSASEGKFVGLLSGYDNNESLSFDADCEATDVSVKDFTSVYTKANNSAWITDDVTNKYDGWLGHETYRRAKVTFAGVRMAPRWDGTTATAIADLLYDGKTNKYEVHSPFDLAGVRNATASPAALYLMENVDMFGQGEDGKYNVPDTWAQSKCTSEDDNYFKSFSTIVNLDGNNYGIYNLNINTQKVSTSLYYGGFIQSTSGTTTHKNIKFHNSCVVVPLVVYKNEDKGSAGMLVSNIAGDSYTMENVHTYGCKIFALQKVGGLAARVAATSTSISNCSVNDCYIENYKCEENLETFSGGNSLASVSTTFYSYGEVGGMFGFVEQNATIVNCKVNGTTIYAFGQDDKAASKSGLAFILSSYYTVPGRHVGTFIGDIRTTASGGGTITMNDISVDNTKCTNRLDKHNNKCETVGRAYFLYLKDDQGTVKYNGTKLTLQNCKNNQNRNQ